MAANKKATTGETYSRKQTMYFKQNGHRCGVHLWPKLCPS